MNPESLQCFSQYVPMSDNVRLAVSYWPPKQISKKTPAVLITTRYWRAAEYRGDNLQSQVYYPLADYLFRRGYILVVADARGTGASFGTRAAETDCKEVADIPEIIDWVGHQSWCDGSVATCGTSYSAITTLYSLMQAPDALRMAVCRAPDFDMYRHLFAPGGVINQWFIQSWGAVTAAQDNNDTEALFANGYWPSPKEGNSELVGVLPVDKDVRNNFLATAISEHNNNFNIAAAPSLNYIEDFISEKNPPLYSEANLAALKANKIPLIVHCGWHDAATALGALALAMSAKTHVTVILGPWNHEGSYLVDPFYSDSEDSALPMAADYAMKVRTDALDMVFKPSGRIEPQGQRVNAALIQYFTLGENHWKTTCEWPLPETDMQRWYFAANRALSNSSPSEPEGAETYWVDPTATTGVFNRWHAQSPNQPIYFPDRREEDKKLVVFDSPVLAQDTEITGSPVVTLFVSSSAHDGYFFIYLEHVDERGQVRLLTEGQLRGLHRKVSKDLPPYPMFGPFHSLMKKDAAPIVPDEIFTLSFDLLPISVLLKKGHRIRVAIAGADKDTFAPLPGCESPTLVVERNSRYPSFIDLPIINRAG